VARLSHFNNSARLEMPVLPTYFRLLRVIEILDSCFVLFPQALLCICRLQRTRFEQSE
jgi:hypothetical protein